MKAAPLLLAVLALWGGMISASAEENENAARLIKAVVALPDIAFDYRIERSGGANKPDTGEYVQFLKSGPRYLFKAYRLDDAERKTPETAASFDGIHYYALNPRVLIVGSDPLSGANGANIALIQSFFLQNPWFNLFGEFHEQSKQNPFYLPSLALLPTWTGSAHELDWKFKETGSEVLVMWGRVKGQYHCQARLDKQTWIPQCTSMTAPDGTVFKKEVVAWQSVKVAAGQEFRLPSKLVTQVQKGASSPVIGGTITVIPESVHWISEARDFSEFQIPYAMAANHIDTDVIQKHPLPKHEPKPDPMPERDPGQER